MTAAGVVDFLPLERNPATVVAPYGDDLVLMASTSVHILRGQDLAPTARAILARVDGLRSAAELAESLPQFSAAAVQEIVARLLEARILVPSRPALADAARTAGIAGASGAWKSHAPAVRKAGAPRVPRGAAVLGDGPDAEALAGSLVEAGLQVRYCPLGVAFPDSADLVVAVALDGGLRPLLDLNAQAVAHGKPLLAAFEHPYRRFIANLLAAPGAPCLECLRRRLRGAGLGSPEGRAVDDAAFSSEGSLLVRPRSPSAADGVFQDAFVDQLVCALTLIGGSGPAAGSSSTARGLDLEDGEAEVVSVDDDGVARRHRLLVHPSCRSCRGAAVRAPVLHRTDVADRLNRHVDNDLGLLVALDATPMVDVLGATHLGTLAQAVASNSAASEVQGVTAPAGLAFAASDSQAALRAIMEALERYGLQMDEQEGLIRGTFRHLRPHALDPRELPLYSAQQYAADGFPWRPFDPDSALWWVKGRRLLSNDVLYVPSDLVYWFGRTNHLAQGTSSGAAAHTSWHAAALHGLCEVVERDAAMLTWYARLAPPRIDEHGLPAETEVHLAVLRQAGYRVSLRLLSRDLDLPVAMCVARRFDGRIPALLLGTGCAPDARNAVARASGEILKSYLAYVHSDGAPSVWADPGPAEAALQPWQHLAYYARGAHRSALDLLDSSAGTVALDELRASDGTPAEELHRCLELLAAQGLDPIGVDYTPRDLRLIGVVLVKVLVPGLQPLHFGEAFRVLGGRRLYDLPARLGRATQRLEADDLNPLPHPFP